MSDILNTYSSSFKYDLKKIFTFKDEDVKNFLSKDLFEILDKQEIKEKINNFKNLKQFLGKKRNKEINDQEFIQNHAHFKISVSKEKVNNLQINSDINNNLYVKEDNNYLTIYKNPKILIKFFDSQSINIDLVNDNEFFESRMNDLNKYDFKIYYSVNTDSNELAISNGFEFEEKYNKSIEIENENIYPYLLVINSQIPEITKEDLLYKNIYKTLDEKNGLISPNDISSIFFYYFRISSELQKKYVYIQSANRKELYSILSQFIIRSFKNIIIILGPKGIGKTTSLIEFSFNEIFRIFYFNLESFDQNSGDLKIKELKIQTTKLFGNLNQKENKTNNKSNSNINDKNTNNEKDDVKSHIENYIEKNSNINGFEFIYNIIKLFKDFAKNQEKTTFGFIIDQYSFNYENDDNYNISSIINLINDTNNIKLILSPTINNIFSKRQINSIFSQSLKNDNNLYYIYYFQEFISKDKFLENIASEKDEEYRYVIDEFGYSPKHFYDINNSDMDTYKQYVKQNIKSNLEEYYSSNNNKNKISYNIAEILNLLDIVKSEKLICSLELKNMITKLPLKYLKIIKYKIDNNFIKNLSNKFEEYRKKWKKKKKNEKDEVNIFIEYLKIIWNKEKNYEYDQIIKGKFFIGEGIIDNYIDNYFEKDKISMNIYGNYYKTFIDNNNNLFDPLEHSYKYIYVYKLEFSFNLIENIYLEIIYNHIKTENLIFSDILDKGAFGGIFELLFGFYIQKSGLFSGEKIEQTIYISSLVPFNYSINYYSFYNKEIKKFKELKLENNKKRKIPFKNTFIKQIIFNSKYYDMGILLKTLKDNTYKIILIQATIRKDDEKRFTKDEHELIARSVKLNLENEYEINIEKAYFIYALSKKNGEIEDQETKKDCNAKKIEYIGFDLDNFEKDTELKINYEYAFITDVFPIHNAASLLLCNKKDDLIYKKLKSIIDKNKKSSKELNNYKEHIEKIFKNKYGCSEFSLSQIKYFEINNSLFEKNKELLNYLTVFSFLIFILKKQKGIYLHFEKTTYNFQNDYEEFNYKQKKQDIEKILFCYSTVPLMVIKNKSSK